MGHSLLIVGTLWSNICVHLYCPWLLCHGFSQQSFLRCQNQCQEPDSLGMCHKYGVSMQIVSQSTLKCKVTALQYPEYKSEERRVDKTISQWKKGIAEQQGKSETVEAESLSSWNLCALEVTTPELPLWYCQCHSQPSIPCLNCWDWISRCPYLFVCLFTYLFAVTSKSGRKSEGAVDHSLLDVIEISWSSVVQAYFIVTCSKIHPWKNWCFKLGISVPIGLVFIPAFGSSGQLPALTSWANEGRGHLLTQESEEAQEPHVISAGLRKDFEVWSQHYAPNSSGGLWLWGKSFCSRAGKM